MNKTWNNVVWVILFLLIIPSSLIVASWNSLPGSRLFGIKLDGEQAIVALVPSQQAKGTLQIAFTQRRFSDAKKLLADNTSASGLSYLDSQINTTKEAIVTTSDPVVKRQLAAKYIATLRDVNSQLEAQKQIMQASATSPQATKISTAAQPAVQQPPQVIVQQQTVVVYQIVQTQQTIVQTIQQIQTVTPETSPQPTPTFTPTPTLLPTNTPTPSPTPRRGNNGNNGNGNGMGNGKND